jgi:hypothetical protein
MLFRLHDIRITLSSNFLDRLRVLRALFVPFDASDALDALHPNTDISVRTRLARPILLRKVRFRL